MTEGKIKRGAPARDPLCYQTRRDIVIPAGTILRHVGQESTVQTSIGFGNGVEGVFTVEVSPAAGASGVFQRVMA